MIQVHVNIQDIQIHYTVSETWVCIGTPGNFLKCRFLDPLLEIDLLGRMAWHFLKLSLVFNMQQDLNIMNTLLVSKLSV